ncbi:MAG: HsdR family type I site-specific deoxyribonuclease, partial [Ureaplasma sp.]|nr:HsdR family type I site-specific deoxyribonuclease [Ureaplasma sp.]
LKIIKNYIHYANKNSRNTKFVPRYHQFVCCEKCFASLKQKNGNKCGFVWHTQGSGKTITMLFLAKQIMQMETSNKYKIVFVTDRNSLDNQLFTTFKSANKFLNLEAKQINSRDELIDVLSKDNNPGIYMTTIQKFFEKTNVLSKKENIIVIADEAHRSHNNIEIDEIYDDEKSNFIIKKGYAYFLREAFPNAKFIGFTGTPLIKDDKTKEIFGDIIDKYTMEQAEIDAAVVPIKYQKNTIQRTLKEDAQKIKELDEIYQNETENEMRFISQSQKAKIRTQLNNFYKSYSDPKTINTIVTKFWFDYNQRKNILHGKAMFVAFNRQVAVKIYKEMISQNPEFKEKIKLIISNSNKDSEEILEITRNINEYEITGEFKNPDSKIKILVVVDKLLTGYDVPDLDTIYIFKVIKFHNLMQTVARVNRTYSDNKNKKEYGLVVDYIGIAQHLEQALIQYSNFSNDSKSDFNIEITITKLKDSLLEIRKEHFLENNIYQYWMIEQDNAKRIDIIKDAINHIGKL